MELRIIESPTGKLAQTANGLKPVFRLEEWYIVGPVAWGKTFDRKGVLDGTDTRTSAILFHNQKDNWIETRNSVYLLGEPYVSGAQKDLRMLEPVTATAKFTQPPARDAYSAQKVVEPKFARDKFKECYPGATFYPNGECDDPRTDVARAAFYKGWLALEAMAGQALAMKLDAVVTVLRTLHPTLEGLDPFLDSVALREAHNMHKQYAELRHRMDGLEK